MQRFEVTTDDWRLAEKGLDMPLWLSHIPDPRAINSTADERWPGLSENNYA